MCPAADPVFKRLGLDLPDFNQAPGREVEGGCFLGEEGVNPHPIPVFIQSVYDRKPIALIVFLFFTAHVLFCFYTVCFLPQRPVLTGLEQYVLFILALPCSSEKCKS